jgi:hypothetical protein
MTLCRPKFGRNVVSILKNCRKIFYDIWFDFGSQKKKIVKNGQNTRNFRKKMKFKIRLVAGIAFGRPNSAERSAKPIRIGM